MGSVFCSDEWEMASDFAQAHMVQEGPWYRISTRETLALQAGVWYRVSTQKIIAKHDILL
jgi:hypothetical protein